MNNSLKNLFLNIRNYELGDMENAYKYFDLTYNELRYTPFSMEDKKYWQFYKQRKEEINPKKKTKSKIRYFQMTFFVPYLTAATPTTRSASQER